MTCMPGCILEDMWTDFHEEERDQIATDVLEFCINEVATIRYSCVPSCDGTTGPRSPRFEWSKAISAQDSILDLIIKHIPGKETA